MCVGERDRERESVCVCAGERDRERGKKRGRRREGEEERERAKGVVNHIKNTICNVYLHIVSIRYTNIFSSRKRERETKRETEKKKRGRKGEREGGGGCVDTRYILYTTCSIQYVTCICI